jgi:hypothetical protein
MKLLLENWRKYLAESERADSYGSLYLFEGDTVSKVSFYDTFNTLSESEDDVRRFLENWEKSVDYQLSPLNEITAAQLKSDPVLAIANQAWLVLDKFKDKAVDKVVSAARKLKKFESENPKTAKVIKFSIGGLLAAAIAYKTYKIVQAGGDASQLEQLAQSIQDIVPEMAQNVADAAHEGTPEALSDLVADQEKVVSQTADALGSLGDAAADQIGQSADQLAQDLAGEDSHDLSWFEEKWRADSLALENHPFVQQVQSALEELATSFKEKVGLDVRMGSKFLAGSETEMTNEALTSEQLEFLTDVVREVTEDGTKDQTAVHYGHWDAAAEAQTTSDFYTTPEGVDTQVCYDAMDAGESMPGFCLGQVNPADILSSDMAIQFKRTLGKAKVTQISDGVYEITDFYDFEGTEAPIYKEIAAAVKDLVDTNNDQKAYTIIHRIFQMRSKTGYEGFPVRLVVDLTSQGGGIA